MAGDEFRVRSYATWEAMAPGWDEKREWIWQASRALGEWMVDRLDPQPGDTLLELAAGPGDTGFLAAARLGSGGRLISSDFSPAMVEAARRRGDELGIENADYRVLDAERLELEDDSVDGVLCRWGYMLMADPRAAFAETRRVLRPGGRLVFSVWGPSERNPWALTGRVLVERGHIPPPEPGAPGLFSLADGARVEELLASAGFASPELEHVEVTFTFPHADAFWRFVTDLAGALSSTIVRLSPEEQGDVRRETERQVEAFRQGEGFALPGLTLNAVTS